jgi:large conductance mechanosensitive channel
MLKEFKEFAMRGNMMDMAVGIIIGAAFGAIVKSLVADVIMPPIGMLLGNVDFGNIFLTLKEGTSPPPYASLDAAKEAGAVVMSWGNKAKKKEEAPPAEPTTKECSQCLSTIPIKAARCAHCTSELKAA